MVFHNLIHDAAGKSGGKKCNKSIFLCIFASGLVTAKVLRGNAVKVGNSPAAVSSNTRQPSRKATVRPEATREGEEAKEQVRRPAKPRFKRPRGMVRKQ